MGEETVRERVDEHVRMQCASIFLGSEMRRKWWLRQSGSWREGRQQRAGMWKARGHEWSRAKCVREQHNSAQQG